MRKVGLFVLVVLALSLGCVAADKAEVFGGYSYFRADTGTAGISSVNTNGWDAAVTGKLNRFLGVTAEVNGESSDNILGSGVSGSLRNFLFGPTVSFRAQKLTPFAHALFGVSRLSGDTISTDNSFAMAYGGGVDMKINKMLAVRLGQIDWVRTQFNDATQNNLRYSTGIVVRF
jgi:opacity protein-like surface antigen